MEIGQKSQFKMDLSPLVRYETTIKDYQKAIQAGIDVLELSRTELRALENGPVEEVQVLMEAVQRFSKNNLELQLEISSIVDMYKWIHTVPELKKFIEEA